MTAIASALCGNGIVIGADSASTYSGPRHSIIEQPSEKICIIDDHIIIAGTGAVGLNQRFCHIVKRLWDEKQFKDKADVDIGKMLSQHMMKDFQFTGITPGNFGALVAFSVSGHPSLFEFGIQDFQPELKTKDLWFCTMGSTQYMTDPFLGLLKEVFWRDRQPDVSDGIYAITWTLDHAIKLNVGGVNGPARLAVLKQDNKGRYVARLIEDLELEEIRQNIEEAKEALRDIRTKQRGEGGGEVPQVPKLE